MTPPFSRISIAEYAINLARVAAMRSEDPYTKVGAVALTRDRRVIATAYNGLAPGYTADEDFWADREKRLKFMIHAEINLCSLFKRDEAFEVAVTHMPCSHCMIALCAHGVKIVWYGQEYHRDNTAKEIADKYGIILNQVTPTLVPDFSLQQGQFVVKCCADE